MALAAYHADAQYYYKDIITNKQITTEMEAYRQAKVKSIKIKSFEDDGSPSEGFFCQKKIFRGYKKIELLTKSSTSAPAVFTSYFNEDAKILSTEDSSDILSTTTQYKYNNSGKLISVISTSRSDDDDFKNEMEEEHLYVYNNSDLPEKMIRIRNKQDSVTILFSRDENNNIGIEKDTKNGSKYYYYYDDKKRIADIVLSNDFKKGLVPTFVFEYNNAGLVTQMTVSEEGIANYLVWKYSYENGLRVKEKCYSKQRRLMGSIEYEYN